MSSPVGSLKITVQASANGPVVLLSGEADAQSAAELTEALRGQTGSGADLVTVDLSGLQYADSVSMRVLIVAYRAQRKHGGTLKLTGIQPPVARSLTLLGVGPLFGLDDTAAP